MFFVYCSIICCILVWNLIEVVIVKWWVKENVVFIYSSLLEVERWFRVFKNIMEFVNLVKWV